MRAVTLEAAARAGSRPVPLVPIIQWVLGLLLVANLGRIPVAATGGRALPILVNDLAVGAMILLCGVGLAQHRQLRLDRVSFLALLFMAVGGVSALLAIPRFGLSLGAVLVSLSYLARWAVYFAIYLIVTNVVRSGDVTRVWRALEGTILVFSAFGVVQSIFLPNFAQIVYPDSRAYLDWDPQGHRLVSTFLDPNYAGAFILIGLLVALGQLAMGARVAWWKLAVLFPALLMTASRSALLAFMVAAMVIMVVRGLSKQLLRAAAIGMVVLLAASPWLLEFARSFNKLEMDASALTRIMNWVHGLTIVADHPILGIGFNTWGFVQQEYGWLTPDGAHAASFGIAGGLLFVAALTGLVGLAVYVAMLGAIVRRARRVWRDRSVSPEHRGIALGGAALVPMIVVHSLFTNSIFYPFLMEALWVVWALTLPMLQRENRDDTAAAVIAPTAAPTTRIRVATLPAARQAG